MNWAALAQVLKSGFQGAADNYSAMTNPEAFRQRQENRRQAAQLAAQLNLRNTMTPYEQAQLERQKSLDEGAASQQEFENQMKLAGGISSGSLQQVYGPQQTSQFDPSAPGQDILSQLGMGSATVPGVAPGQTPLEAGGISAIPNAPSYAQTHTISKKSPLGQAIGLDNDLTGISTEDYVRYALPQMEKLSLNQDKRTQLDANSRALDGQLPSNVGLIAQRFSPSYYQPMGAVDPMAQSLALNFTQRLKDAAETDRRKGDMSATTAVMKELSTYKSPWEEARHQQLTRQMDINARAQQNQQLQSDRSYTFHEKELDQLSKPVDELASRFSRLEAALEQNSPQADALIAPELMTVMAGGSGSGLRMSEAEISRQIGGRSNWEALKASINKWSLDPKTANSILPDQRQQIRSLVGEVKRRLDLKRAALNNGYASLAGSYDPLEHRKIYDRTRKAVSDANDVPSGSGVVDSLVSKYK
jgi:hypothetical protein